MRETPDRPVASGARRQTPTQIRRNVFAREAELLRRIETQQRHETIVFRALLVLLAVVGAWLIWLRNSYAGTIAIPTDIILVAMYWTFIGTKLRDDFRS